MADVQVASPSVQSLLLQPSLKGDGIATATGFVVVYDEKPYLITNWHVVSGRNPQTGQANDNWAKLPDAITIVHNSDKGLGNWLTQLEALFDASEKPLWLEHPKWHRSVDVVALPLTQLSDVKLYPYELDPPIDVAFRVAGNVSIIGFPFGITGGGGALAVWSSGTLATEPQIDYADSPLMLVDSRTRPGQSGSPTLFYSTGGSIPMADGSLGIMGGEVIKLLGVYSGRINAQSDLGMVWKVQAIKDILSSGVIGNGEMTDSKAPPFPIKPT